jgi:DNA-binding MarR family transcriptional regulator
MEIADLLHSVSLRLLRRVRRSDLLAPVGPAQLSALSVLYFSGPIALGALAEVEQVSQPTMSRIVHSLFDVGAVTKVRDPSDGRSQLIEIAGVGRTIFEASRRRRLETVRDLISGLSPMTLQLLALTLPEIARAIGGPPAGEAGTGEGA